jgi:hypothetical protein
MSLAKVLGVLYAVLGLFVGVIFAIVSVFGGLAAQAESQGTPLAGLLLGVGALVFMPIIYAVLGFVGGLLVAVIYNFVARFVGGVELDLK